MSDMDMGLVEAVAAMRTKTALAEALGISLQAVSGWDKIPLSRLLDVEKVTGVPREKLRPDLYRQAAKSE